MYGLLLGVAGVAGAGDGAKDHKLQAIALASPQIISLSTQP